MTNIHHLALFICHLFIDGRFRTAHILYERNQFDFDLLTQIDSICTNPIPLYLTEITQPWTGPWNEMDNPDNILQLCFFDPIDLRKDISRLEAEGTSHYQIFFFHSNNIIDREMQTLVFDEIRHFWGLKALIVYYDEISVFSMDLNENSNRQANILVDVGTDFENINLFDLTFGEIERSLNIAIHRDIFDDHSGVLFDSTILFMHFYHLQLNNSFINLTRTDRRVSPPSKTSQHCALRLRDSYKELVDKYECTQNGNSSKHNLIGLHLMPYSLVAFYDSRHVTTFHALYPYHSRIFKVFFLYGTDYRRETDIFRVSKSVKMVAALILLLLITATLALYMIRRRFKLAGRSIVSSIVDCLIPFIGGGNLRMEHRFERWFFGILLIGAFFIVSVFGGDLVDSVVRIFNSKIETFEKLSEIHPSIYFEETLATSVVDLRIVLGTKMRQNTSDFKTTFKPFRENTSSLLIVAPDNFEFFIAILEFYNPRDYDILKEPLGEIPDRYILTSSEHISERTIERINRVSSSMVEHGFRQFYHSKVEFQTKLALTETLRPRIWKNKEDDDDSQPITMEQLKKPIIIVLCLDGIAVISILAEILLFKWKNWHNSQVWILPLVGGKPLPKSGKTGGTAVRPSVPPTKQKIKRSRNIKGYLKKRTKSRLRI